MAAAKYHFQKTEFGNYHVIRTHKNTEKLVGIIEPVDSKSFLRKTKTVYHVTRVPDASNEPFDTVEGAFRHAVQAYKKHVKRPAKHPLKRIGNHLDRLSKEIEEVGKHPRMNSTEAQEALLKLAQHHAKFLDLYRRHVKSNRSFD